MLLICALSLYRPLKTLCDNISNAFSFFHNGLLQRQIQHHFISITTRNEISGNAFTVNPYIYPPPIVGGGGGGGGGGAGCLAGEGVNIVLALSIRPAFVHTGFFRPYPEHNSYIYRWILI